MCSLRSSMLLLLVFLAGCGGSHDAALHEGPLYSIQYTNSLGHTSMMTRANNSDGVTDGVGGIIGAECYVYLYPSFVIIVEEEETGVESTIIPIDKIDFIDIGKKPKLWR